MKKIAKIHLLFLVVLFFFSCGVSSDTKQKFEIAKNSLKTAKPFVEQKQKEYEKLQQSKDWSFLSYYSDEESWTQYFEDAATSLSEAEEKVKKTSDLLGKRSNEDAVIKAVDVINKLTSGAKSQAKKALARADNLLEAKKKAPEFLKTAKSGYETITSIAEQAKDLSSKTARKHPNRRKDLQSLYEEFTDIVTRSSVPYKTILSIEEHLEQDTFVNYAKLLSAKKRLIDEANTAKKQLSIFVDQTASLDESYSKTLIDMRKDYYIQVGRTAWDESDDFTKEHEYTYSMQKVDEETYKKLASNTGTIAYSSSGWGSDHSFSKTVSGFSKLNLSPNVAMQKYDDRAEYWINNYLVKYYHKYVIEEDGKVLNTEWQEVGEEMYEDYIDALNMTIESKPYGMFYFETTEEASPPGLEYVGNSKYGEWRKDGTGNSFWHYYGIYSFWTNHTAGYRYSRSDWNNYQKNYRGAHTYYGTDKSGNRKFGVGGTVGSKSNIVTSSSYVRRNPGAVRPIKASTKRTTPLKRTSSIRNAASVTRGRGPGGGGK